MSDKSPIDKIRNIGFIAHIDAGKTTVTERVLYLAGRIHRVGDVDEGTTVMDWMPQEKERGITITSAATTCFWDDHRINIIDTPGHVDFTAEVERSLRVLDGGIVVLDAVAGVQPQSETVWRQADKYNVPRICFVNKMDRLGASFERTIGTIRHRLKVNAIPIQLPIQEDEHFRGVVDLMQGRAMVYEDNNGMAPHEEPIPDSYQDAYQQHRDAMLEKIVETDDALMIRYLEGETIGVDDLMSGLRKATITGQLIPVVCGTAPTGRGIHPLMNAIISYLPSPADVPAVTGVLSHNGQEVVREAREDTPMSSLAFKVITDPFVGRLVYLRVYSGSVKSGASVVNVTKNINERMGRVLQMHANRREEIEEVGAGNICAAVGLKNTFTGDTICTREAPVVLEPPKFPLPVLSVAIEPMSKADQDKLSDALDKLAEEDPTFFVQYDKETGQTLISGMGELHLEVLVDRIRREFHVGANVGKPKVSYREAITTSVKSEGRFVRQSGGRGQYGHVWLQIEPTEPGEGFKFENRIEGGVIPREYIPAVQAGVKEALNNGPIAGYPVVDIKVSLYDGSFHTVDSSEIAFKAAGSIAFRDGVKKAHPHLLEPVMDMEVVTPGDFLGDVLGDLNSRRAQIRNIEGHEGIQVVRVMIPLGETFAYTTTLRSVTQGRATYTMEFRDYEPVPEGMVQGIIRGVLA
ncbi:MAG: elongation factor G [Dehalococcoidia bacterium]|nr:elongation factor G [Dehalococcoidia bacterium]